MLYNDGLYCICAVIHHFGDLWWKLVSSLCLRYILEKGVKLSNLVLLMVTNLYNAILQVCDTLDVPKGAPNPYKDLVVRRTNWKTIRIFVSSTFKDFHREREILVKEVWNIKQII